MCHCVFLSDKSLIMWAHLHFIKWYLSSKSIHAYSVLMLKNDQLCIFVCLPLEEHAGDDTTSLYLEERESQIQQAAEEKRNKMLAIPGIINPPDRPDDMQQEWTLPDYI